MSVRSGVVVCAVLLSAGCLCAGDWPQWRGPERNGLAPNSPALVEEFAVGGPEKLWANDEIKSGDDAGHGSVAVSEGKVYVFQNLNLPPVERVIFRGVFDKMGYAPDMPAELAKVVEEARVSPERKDMDARALDPWIRDWLDAHLTEDQRRWRGAVQARLKAGPGALSMDVLAKIAPIVDKRFPTEAALNEWMTANQIDEDSQKVIRPMAIPGEEKAPYDFAWCLDEATGKMLWKTELSAQWFYYPASSTPTVAGGKCYVLNSEAKVFCLDAKTGGKLWASEALGSGGYHHNRSSSPLIIGGVVLVYSETCLAGIDASDGKVLWRNGNLKNQQSSLVPWSAGGKSYAIANASGQLSCVDPADGSVLWSAPCGGASTPTVVGDYAAVAAGDPIGLVCYKLSVEKAEQLWRVPWKDAHSAPVIYDGNVYALGGAFYDKGMGRAICVDLKSGKVNWEQVIGPPQHSSPLVADGKIIAVSGSALLVFKATPEKYTQIGAADVGAAMWPSPAFADGKVFLRTATGVACYKLAK